MLTALYQRHGRWLLVLAALAFPFLAWQGETMPSNNDLETWLPLESDVRSTYEMFKQEFGAEEVILVGLPNLKPDDPLVEAVAERLTQLSGIRHCWSPNRFGQAMRDLNVPEEKIQERLTGLALAKDKRMVGLVALLSPQGLIDRAGTVRDVEKVLDYCQLRGDDVLLTGGPVVVAELNRLGGVEHNRTFFTLTLLISAVLLYFCVKEWRLTAGILLITVFAIESTNAVVHWLGGEMNFVMGAMPVMTMVFAMSIAVHFVSYYKDALSQPDPLIHSLQHAWKPVFLSSLTTVIGLASLMTSSIGPVWWFGLAGAIGATISFLCGLGLTPALLLLWPDAVQEREDATRYSLLKWSHLIIQHRKKVTALIAAAVIVCGSGVVFLQCRIDPLDFLPQGSPVVRDLNELEARLTSIDSIEAIVDFNTSDAPFMQKMDRVRLLEAKLASHPNVTHTMSIASFFPEEMPGGMMESARIFSKAMESEHRSDFLSAGERYWRVSCRIGREDSARKGQTLRDLHQLVADSPDVTLTGIAPLIEQAQVTIFQGFWGSLSSSFILITIVFMISLRSVGLAFWGMVPNVSPILMVFGLIGWSGMSVDIGVMMTASIALGMVVDGTFHSLIAFQAARKAGHSSETASFHALIHTGKPIAEAAMIASVGMLALFLSSFTPTLRFGMMMAGILVSSIWADLIQMPAILAMLPGKRVRQTVTLVLPGPGQSDSSKVDSEEDSEIEEHRAAA